MNTVIQTDQRRTALTHESARPAVLGHDPGLICRDPQVRRIGKRRPQHNDSECWGRPQRSRFPLMSTTVLFTCPNTKLKVQHWLPDESKAPDDDYESVICQSCTRVHFVNRKGKVFGSKYS